MPGKPKPKRRPDIVAKRMVREGSGLFDITKHLVTNFGINVGEARELVEPMVHRHHTRKTMARAIFDGLRVTGSIEGYGDLKRRMIYSRRLDHVPDKGDYKAALQEAVTSMVGFHLNSNEKDNAARLLRKADLPKETKDSIWEQEMDNAMQKDIKFARTDIHNHVLDSMKHAQKAKIARMMFDSIVSGAEPVQREETQSWNYNRLWRIAADRAMEIAMKYDMPRDEMLDRLRNSYATAGSFSTMLRKLKTPLDLLV